MKVETYKTKHSLVKKNPLTGDYLITPLETSPKRIKNHAYYSETKRFASQLAQTMDYYEETGQRKKFPPNLRYLGKMFLTNMAESTAENIAKIQAACKDALLE